MSSERTTRLPATVGGAVARALESAAGLVWPTQCAGCGEPDVRWCPRCHDRLVGQPREVHPPAWTGLAPIWAAAEYAGEVSRLLVAWKDRGRHDLTPLFARALVEVVTAALAGRGGVGQVVLVAVPSSTAARRRRAGDRVGDLTAATARRMAWRPPVAALTSRRRLIDQAGLGADQRLGNRAGAYRLRRGARARVNGRSVVLVDDIVTTGATVNEAVRVLEEAGAAVEAVVVVAATRRRDRGS
jgi:predicted amidophosphoribosyltransferase